MAMMHAYGKCARCGEEGALWRKTVRRFWLAWLFGLKAQKTIYVCDECDSLFAEDDDVSYSEGEQPVILIDKTQPPKNED